MATAAGGLPLIPLSPIAKSVIAYGNTLAHATEDLTEAKQANPPVSLSTLRRLVEDVRVERSRIDKLTGQMYSVHAATAFHWDPDVLARQIAVVDCQLYANVALQKRWLCQQDKKQTNLGHLLDFHRYLTHSFAHQLIYWAELTKGRPPVQKVIPLVHPKDNLVSHLVRVAYLLLHAYRDFSGLAAVMKALMLPEVRRLRKLWQLPSRIKEMHRELICIVSSTNNYEAYHESLRNKIGLFARTGSEKQHGSASAMIAVPWIQPHLLAIQSIVTAYTAGDHDEISHSIVDNIDIVLSAPGARKLAIIVSILELCQHSSTTESADLLEDELGLTNTSNRRVSTMKPLHIDGLRSSIVPIPDLNRLAPGDLLAHHWLVSRVYLKRDQLIDESIEVEPLMANETLTPDDDEEEHRVVVKETPVRAPEPEHLSPRPASISSARAISESTAVDMSSAVIVRVETETPGQGDSSDSDNDSNDNDRDNSSSSNDIVCVSSVKDIMAVKETKLIANVPAYDGDTTDLPAPVPVSPTAKNTPEFHEDSKERVAEQDLQGVWSNVDQNKILNESPEQPKSVAAQSTATGSVSTQQNSATSKQTKKSRLSPTAPEFVPLNRSMSLSVPVPNDMPSSIIVSPASSVNNMQDLESIIGYKGDAEEEESQDEVWQGYPADANEENDSEKWNGYPSPASDETMAEDGEEDDEVWKGYPMPADAADPNPRRGSSHSEASEGWKGYHAGKMEAVWQIESTLKVQQHDWQGYTLETLNEDELDSSTMMDGEFEKSRQARGQQADDPLEAFQAKGRKMQNTSFQANRPVPRFKP
ncbi:hypothetical protein DFQ28_005929 [Apophysomyces sp. BC1034]|nr:hypothetical protein DFQ30_005843 [Apophysomyces sp. BC1015]KAG0177438.1 hypothetical protein DFQ29_004831 [Apophysomyces sp. BC1021]KAG0187734.1 hypothetical protein DFQ28_005929 [Apophysomyces sp. BC1034]